VPTYVHKYSPPILHNQWITNAIRNPNVELRNANDLYVTTALSEQVKKLPLIAFEIVWNNLPDNKLHRNPNLFKPLLKEHIWSLVTEELFSSDLLLFIVSNCNYIRSDDSIVPCSPPRTRNPQL
jgi:hypothetical protein